MKKIYLSQLVLIFFLTSCSTLFSPSKDKITIKSEPSGAVVRINGKEVGLTPYTQVFDRDTFSQKRVTLSLKNYQSKTFVLKKELEKVALLNFILGTSWSTDALTGDAFKYAPNAYYIELESKKVSQKKSNLKTKKFVIKNYHNIMIDLSKGDGTFLTSYAKLLGTTTLSLRTRLKPHLSKLSKSQDGVHFYRQMTSLL